MVILNIKSVTMPIIKTYEISFWAGETLVCAMKVDGRSKTQVQALGDNLADHLQQNLLSLVIINPDTACTAFMWLLLGICGVIIFSFIRGANRSVKAQKANRRNDLWERNH